MGVFGGGVLKNGVSGAVYLVYNLLLLGRKMVLQLAWGNLDFLVVNGGVVLDW